MESNNLKNKSKHPRLAHKWPSNKGHTEFWQSPGGKSPGIMCVQYTGDTQLHWGYIGVRLGAI